MGLSSGGSNRDILGDLIIEPDLALADWGTVISIPGGVRAGFYLLAYRLGSWQACDWLDGGSNPWCIPNRFNHA